MLKDDKADYVVCSCMGVMLSELINAIVHGAATFEELQQQFFVGTGCSSCVDEVHAILQSCTKDMRRNKS